MRRPSKQLWHAVGKHHNSRNGNIHENVYTMTIVAWFVKPCIYLFSVIFKNTMMKKAKEHEFVKCC